MLKTNMFIYILFLIDLYGSKINLSYICSNILQNKKVTPVENNKQSYK